MKIKKYMGIRSILVLLLALGFILSITGLSFAESNIYDIERIVPNETSTYQAAMIAGDVNAPTILSVWIDPNEIQIGSSINIYAKAGTSIYGIDFIVVEFLSPSHNYTKTSYLHYNLSSGLFQDTLSMADNDEEGDWTVMKVKVFDNASNTRYYYNNEIYITSDLIYTTDVLQDLSWMDFTVIGDEYYFSQGRELYNQGNYTEALTMFNQAISLNSNIDYYYDWKGVSLINLQRYEEGLSAYNRAIQLDPNDWYYFNQKGQCLRCLQRLDDALIAYNTAIQLSTTEDPVSYYVYSNKGICLYDLERYQEALESFNQSISLNPNEINYRWKGNCLFELGRYDEAISAFNTVLNFNSTGGYDYYMVGMSNCNLSKFEDSLYYFNRSITLEPNYHNNFYKGNALIELSRYQEALESFNQAIFYDDKNPWCFNNKAFVLCQLFRYEEALSVAELGLSLDENDFDDALYKNKALALYGLKRYSEALVAVNMSLQIAPTYEKAIILKEQITRIIDPTAIEIRIDGNPLSGFSPTSENYIVELAYGTTKVPIVTTVATNSNASILITPTTALPGTTTIKVTAEDGVTAKTYKINFTIAKKNDATLKAIKINGADLNGFNAAVLNYSVELPYATTVIPTIVVTATDPKAQIFITPATALPGTTLIKVTAEDGVTINTYSLSFILEKQPATGLAGLSITEGTDGLGQELITNFASDNLTYSVAVAEELEAVKVVATPMANTNVKIYLNSIEKTDGVISLVPGINNVNLVVGEANKADRIYVITIKRGAVDECFIATAAFGSKFEPAVVLLRHFRDQFLLTNKLGTTFVKFYYHNSPPIAAYIAQSEPLKALVRALLMPVIAVTYSIMHPGVAVFCIILLILILVVRKSRKNALRV